MKIEASPLAVTSEVAPIARTAPVAAVSKAEPGAFAKILARASEQANAHEKRIQEMTHSGKAPALNAEELLALQSDVNQYSATVDLTAKVVGQATQGVQSVLKSGGQ